jgi:hypothetical protein
LLLKQIEHLEWAALPAAQRKPGALPTRKVKTEGQAAERVAQLTTMIREAYDAPAQPAHGARATVVLPPLPKSTIAQTRQASARAAKKTVAGRPKKTSRTNRSGNARGRGRES